MSRVERSMYFYIFGEEEEIERGSEKFICLQCSPSVGIWRLSQTSALGPSLSLRLDCRSMYRPMRGILSIIHVDTW